VERHFQFSIPENFCRTDLVSLPAGRAGYLVYSKTDRSVHLLPAPTTDLLNVCATFRPLAEHAQSGYNFLEMVQPGPADLREQFVIAQLQELRRRGLLVAESSLKQFYREHGEPEVNPKISSVGVVTHDRVQSLERCLLSYIAHSKQHGRTHDFVVMDDFQRSAATGTTVEILHSIKKANGVKIRYAALMEREQFACELVKESGLPPDVVNFALFDTERVGSPIGANRNALFLDTVGELVFSTDDDIVCDVALAFGARNALSFESRGTFTKFWFFANRETTLKSMPRCEVDLLSVHERLLGQTLAGCITEFDDGELSFERVNSAQIQHLIAKRGKVPLTVGGVFGDSAMPTPVMFLLFESDSRRRLLESESTYRSAFASREVLRAVDCPCITDNPFFFAATFGYDNRTLLPPFMPVLRAEDDIFGFTVRACIEDGYFGHLPTAVLHSPIDTRAYFPAFLEQSAARTDMNKIILAGLISFQMGRVVLDVSRRLQTFGRHLMEIASMPQEDFEEFVKVQLWRMHTDTIQQMEGYLQHYQRDPAFWAKDIENYLHHFHTALIKDSFVVPQDLLGSRNAEVARKLSQQLVFKFGQLLYHWPELVEAAKSLRARERRLSVAL
jgi:hypothetical protein